MAPPALTLDVADEANVSAGDLHFAERVLRQAVEVQRDDLPPGTPTVYVSLTLTDDAGIRDLNREYRGVDAATDVLSFPQHDDPAAAQLPAAGLPLLLGDVVVSIPRVEAQAREYGHTRERELGFLLVHGYLHLLGYDHETPQEASAMEARQEAVLRALGLSRDGTS